MKRLLILAFLLWIVPSLAFGFMGPAFLGAAGGGGAAGPSLIHSDGWESDDFTGWDANETDSGDLTTEDAFAGGFGSYCMQALHDDTNSIYVSETFDTAVSEFSCVFYLWWTYTTPDSGWSYINLLEFYDASMNRMAFWKGRYGENGSSFYKQHLYYRNESNSEVEAGNSSTLILSEESQKFEIYYKEGTGSDNGIMKLWYNDALIIDVSNLPNDGVADIKTVRLGIFNSDIDSADFIYKFDGWEIYEGYKDDF